MSYWQTVPQTPSWTGSSIENLRNCSVAGSDFDSGFGFGSIAMRATGAEVSMGASYLSWTDWTARACSANCWSLMTEKEASACWS